jgi:hypothetical protein
VSRPLRPLRAIRLATLNTLLRDVTLHSYLGVGTEQYAIREREAWRREPTLESRARCMQMVAIEIRAEVSMIAALTDEEYASATSELPLSYWSLTPDEVGHYAYKRGLEARSWYGRFGEFGPRVQAGMGGVGWFRIGGAERLTFNDLLPILGFALATTASAEWAANWARAREVQS